MRRAALFAVLMLVAAAPAAQAAYDPRFAVTINPTTPGSPVALTASVTQASGESATASQSVRFPPSFGFNPAFDVVPCPPAAKDAQSCPESSRIGNASAQTTLGEFAGPVHLTEDYKLAIFMRGFGGAVTQEVEGYFVLHPDGSVETVMEGLPNVQSTSGSIVLMGGSKSTLLTPRTCGTHTVTAVFTSHDKDRAERSAPISIAGCDTRPRFVVAAATPSRVRQRSARTVLTWRLSDSGSATAVSIRRVVRSGRFDRVRRELSLRAGARDGANRLALDLRRGGKPLPPGNYLAHLTAVSAQGRETDAITARFRIVR